MFRAHQLKVTLQNPCTENPDNMQPTAGGHFCNTCQKTVTDFTGFTDEDFIRYFQTHKSPGCGKFTQRQFAISIPQKPAWQPFHKIMKPAAALLVSLSLYGKTEAHRAELPALTQTPPQPDTLPQPYTNEETVKIHGTIFEENGEPAVGASVIGKGTKIGAMTDENGEFELDLPLSIRTIIVSYFANKDVEATIHADNTVKVTMERSGEIEEIAVYGGYISKPAAYPASLTRNEHKRDSRKAAAKEKAKRSQKKD